MLGLAAITLVGFSVREWTKNQHKHINPKFLDNHKLKLAGMLECLDKNQSND
jgi:hypothetical protein